MFKEPTLTTGIIVFTFSGKPSIQAMTQLNDKLF